MTPPVRAISDDDLEPLAAVHARCFPLEAWDRRALSEVLAMAHASGFLIEGPAGAPAAFLCDLTTAEETEILTLGVDPDHRRRGLARRLLAHLYGRARAQGARRILLEVASDNVAALRLYESEGFARAGQRRAYYQRSGGAVIDAWLLSRPLAAEDRSERP